MHEWFADFWSVAAIFSVKLEIRQNVHTTRNLGCRNLCRNIFTANALWRIFRRFWKVSSRLKASYATFQFSEKSNEMKRRAWKLEFLIRLNINAYRKYFSVLISTPSGRVNVFDLAVFQSKGLKFSNLYLVVSSIESSSIMYSDWKKKKSKK